MTLNERQYTRWTVIGLMSSKQAQKEIAEEITDLEFTSTAAVVDWLCVKLNKYHVLQRDLSAESFVAEWRANGWIHTRQIIGGLILWIELPPKAVERLGGTFRP